MRDLTDYEPSWFAKLSSPLSSLPGARVTTQSELLAHYLQAPPSGATELSGGHWCCSWVEGWWGVGALAGGRGSKKQRAGAYELGSASYAFSLAEAGVWVVILTTQIILGLSAEHLFSRACLSVTADAHSLMALPLSFAWCRFYLK